MVMTCPTHVSMDCETQPRETAVEDAGGRERVPEGWGNSVAAVLAEIFVTVPFPSLSRDILATWVLEFMDKKEKLRKKNSIWTL